MRPKEAAAFPAGQIGQELQLPYHLRIQFTGPGIAGDLMDIGSTYNNIVKTDSGQIPSDSIAKRVPPTGGIGVRGAAPASAF